MMCYLILLICVNISNYTRINSSFVCNFLNKTFNNYFIYELEFYYFVRVFEEMSGKCIFEYSNPALA